MEANNSSITKRPMAIPKTMLPMVVNFLLEGFHAIMFRTAAVTVMAIGM